MNAQTRISGKGQVVIPKDVRERLRFEPGDRLDVIERNDGVLLRKVRTRAAGSFDDITARIRGRVAYRGPSVSLDEMRVAIDDLWVDGGPRWDR